MKDYFHGHGVKYEQPARTGFCSLPVLQFLWGQPWDEFALNYIHAVRPDCIRVIRDGEGEKTDAWLGRLTVHLNEYGNIRDMSMECAVGLDGYEHGHALRVAGIKKGIEVLR